MKVNVSHAVFNKSWLSFRIHPFVSIVYACQWRILCFFCCYIVLLAIMMLGLLGFIKRWHVHHSHFILPKVYKCVVFEGITLCTERRFYNRPTTSTMLLAISKESISIYRRLIQRDNSRRWYGPIILHTIMKDGPVWRGQLLCWMIQVVTTKKKELKHWKDVIFIRELS